MAAAADKASEDDGSRRRKLPVVDGKLTISESDSLRSFIKTLPAGHYHVELTHLALSGVSMQQIPKDVLTLPNLTRLDCSENQLTQIPPDISKLAALTQLDVSKNQINQLPLSVLALTSLCTLSVKDNFLTELPQLNVLPNLTALKANRNHLHLGRLPPGLTTVMRSFGAQHVPSEIEPGLYLGSYVSAQNLTVLQALRITHILTVARETPPMFPDRFEYRHIKEDDLPTVDLSKYFEEMADYIAKGKAAGGILVHWSVFGCIAPFAHLSRQGISRSATAVAAYLIKKRAITYDGTLDWLRTARQCVNPNSGFRKQLRNLYRECRRLRTPLLPSSEPAPPEAVAEIEEESEEAKDVKEKKEKEKKERKEKRRSSQIKPEQLAAEAAAAAPPKATVLSELDITGDPRKKRAESERKEKEEKKEREDKKEKRDKEHKHKSRSRIERKDPEVKASIVPLAVVVSEPTLPPEPSAPPHTDTTKRSVEMAVDIPPPPHTPIAVESGPSAAALVDHSAQLRTALEAALRAEIEAQVRQELEAKWANEVREREAKIRASLEGEIREQLVAELRAPHTVIELASPTDTETDPLINKPAEQRKGFFSWCSLV